MSSKIGIIIGREYLERVRKKSFIITTLLMPLFMLAMMVAPALIMQFSKSDLRTIAVIDRTGFIAPQLESDEETLFVPMASVELDSALAMTELSGVVYIAEGVADGTAPVKYYSNGPSSMSLEHSLSTQIDQIIETQRLKAYNIDNLSEIMSKVKSDVRIQNIRNDSDGETKSKHNQQTKTKS